MRVCAFFVPNLKIKEMSVKDIYLLSAASSLLSFRIALVQIAIVRAGKMKKNDLVQFVQSEK